MLRLGLLIQLPANVGKAKIVRPTRSTSQGHMASPAIAVAVLADIIEDLVASWVARGVRDLHGYVFRSHAFLRG